MSLGASRIRICFGAWVAAVALDANFSFFASAFQHFPVTTNMQRGTLFKLNEKNPCSFACQSPSLHGRGKRSLEMFSLSRPRIRFSRGVSLKDACFDSFLFCKFFEPVQAPRLQAYVSMKNFRHRKPWNIFYSYSYS